jgi:hypothetical protein
MIRYDQKQESDNDRATAILCFTRLIGEHTQKLAAGSEPLQLLRTSASNLF